jgi:hypothetical protein
MLSRAHWVPALALTLTGFACAQNPRIVCTPGALNACFGIDVVVQPIEGSNDTRVTVHIQNLQGTVPDDNTAWSQLNHIRIHRNLEPSLGFPGGGDIMPTWWPSVTTIGPEPPGSGWRNVGVNSPPGLVSEWIATGGLYDGDGGYIAGRNQTYKQAAKVGAGLRTFSGVGTAPGWVTFTFVAAESFTADDVSVYIAIDASTQPASGLPVPEGVGCYIPGFGLNGDNECIELPYNLD